VIPPSGGAAAGMSGVLLTPQQQSALAARIRSREPSAEEEFVHLFSPRVALMVLVRTHDREAARDLAQDVMLAVVRAVRAEQLRDPERLVGFVFGTARNLINNYLRNRHRLPREDTLEAARHLASPPNATEDTERIALVRRALRALDSTDRTILLLTLVEGLKPAAIGIRLGLTSEVVRARKSRALKKTIDRVKKLSRT